MENSTCAQLSESRPDNGCGIGRLLERARGFRLPVPPIGWSKADTTPQSARSSLTTAFDAICPNS